MFQACATMSQTPKSEFPDMKAHVVFTDHDKADSNTFS